MSDRSYTRALMWPGRSEGQTDRRLGGQKVRRSDGPADRRTGGPAAGRTDVADGQAAGRTGGQTSAWHACQAVRRTGGRAAGRWPAGPRSRSRGGEGGLRVETQGFGEGGQALGRGQARVVQVELRRSCLGIRPEVVGQGVGIGWAGWEGQDVGAYSLASC